MAKTELETLKQATKKIQSKTKELTLKTKESSKKLFAFLFSSQFYEKVPYEVYKNLKLIFRNWTSLLLLILAPLFLILIVGYSFSGENLHGIKIGIKADNSINLSEFKQNVSSFAQIKNYDDINDCLVDMALEQTHMCLELKGNLAAKKGEIPTGEVAFYYDNTKKKTSLLLLTQIKDYFGITSEKISLMSTQQIFDNLQQLLTFLNDRISDIEQVKNESVSIQNDLIDRKQKLVQIRDDFTPKYLLIKSIQEKINSQVSLFNQTADSLLSAVSGVKNATAALDDVSNTTVIEPLDSRLALLITQINTLETRTNATIAEIVSIKTSLDSVVVQLDTINTFLNEEIERTDKYIELIKKSTAQIEETLSQAKDKMKDLSKIDPALASKIVKPITQSFEELVKGLTSVQVTFPVILTTVIIFISLIFSTMITLLEINNKAYTRNILAPVDDAVYTLGIAFTNLLVIGAQIGVLLVVAQASFSVNISEQLGSIIPMIALIMFTFISLGMIIAYKSKSVQTSVLMSTFVALGFFLFSDAVNALEAMPEIASYLAMLNPVVIANSMFRMIFFFGLKLWHMPVKLGILVLYFFIAGYLLIRVSKKKNQQRF
jgi:ABC-type multidrug transport system permease subunit